MEMMNRGFINERPIANLICGTMNKKKTTLLTDMAISMEIIFRDKAFELLLDCDLEFPNFPWINLENNIKYLMQKHIIYNLATCKKYIIHLEKCFSMSLESDKAIKKSIQRHLKKKYHLNFENLLFDYDYQRYGLNYNNQLKIINIWENLFDYAQLYFVYIIQSSLLVANYSIRVDNILEDLGNFPLWNTDLFHRNPQLMDAYSRHSHIIDFDSLRLGKKVIENNQMDFEFGICVVTEFGKERKNALELQEVKKKDDVANQKNDLLNSKIKMFRHSATIRHYPFIWFGCDEQRPESLGADARELCDIIHIDECSEFNLAMPLFSFGDLILQFVLSKFKKNYSEYRFNRGDNSLLMYIYHNTSSKLHKYLYNIYNTYGYYTLKLLVENGVQDGNYKVSKYYLMTKKIYSKRFSTDCFSEVFVEKSLKATMGLDDLYEYKNERACFEEMLLQNSYFFMDLAKLKNL